MDRIRLVQPTDLPKAVNPAPVKTTRDKVFDKVVEFIKEEFGDEVNTGNITNKTGFSAIEGYDSLNVIHIMIKLEEKFSIIIPGKDIEEITTVGQAVDYIITHARTENLP